MNLFGFILFESLCFLDLDICFLLWIEEIFNHYFLKKIRLVHLILSLFLLGPPIMGTLLLLMLSWCSLRISSVFSILFFFFAVLFVWVLTTLSRSVIYSAASSCLLLNTSSVFFSLVVVFFNSVTSVWYFLMFSLCWRSHCGYAFFWVQWASYDHHFESFIS